MNTKNNKKRYNLLVETTPKNVVLRNDKDSPAILEGVFLEAGRINANDRQYDIEDLSRAVNDFQPMIYEGRALSELEHPESTEINPDRACARILKLERDGNQFLGEAVVLASYPDKGIVGTPCGTLLLSLLQYGTKVGWSSRGVGDVSHDNIVRDYHLVTVDCVLNPSTGYMSKNDMSRFVDGVLESTEVVLNNHVNRQLIFEALNKNISKLPLRQDDKYTKIEQALSKFLIEI